MHIRRDSIEAANSSIHPVRDSRPLHEIYPSYFEVREARDQAAIMECLKIRYSVYCIENSYENSQAQVGALETDEYDIRSKHASLHYAPDGSPVGTVRMIYPGYDAPRRSFVLQSLIDWKGEGLKQSDFFPVMSTGEISRFCVTRNFRRRLADSRGIGVPASAEDEAELRRVIPNMTLGLIEWLVHASARDGLTHWCAVMEPTLLRLLGRLGIHFDPIGGLVEFHGMRQPCVAALSPMLERMKAERPDIWAVVTRQGEHAEVLARVA